MRQPAYVGIDLADPGKDKTVWTVVWGGRRGGKSEFLRQYLNDHVSLDHNHPEWVAPTWRKSK